MESLSLQAKPYYCTDVIRQCIKRGLTESPQSFGVQAVARGIDMPVAQLSTHYADMARVRNTPQPDCFRVMLQMFTIIYLLLLPVISYEALGYWVIPEGEKRVYQAGEKGGGGESIRLVCVNHWNPAFRVNRAKIFHPAKAGVLVA